MAAPMMPPSAIGASRTRCSPYLRCRPSVQRKTHAEITHVLAEYDDVRILVHDDVERRTDRLDHVHLRPSSIALVL